LSDFIDTKKLADTVKGQRWMIFKID
jgi:hypothetical protein